MMQIKTVVTGQLAENCYLVWDENKKAIVIDPGDNAKELIAQIEQENLFVEKILLTHGHYDHVGAVNELKNFTNAEVVAHEKEKELLKNPSLSLSIYAGADFSMPEVDSFVTEGDVISVGSLNFRVIHTPGHTEGGMCLYGDNVLFSGDTVFYTTLGRWDFPTGNLAKLGDSILHKIFTLPEETVIYSGHGEKTTVAEEKIHNEVYRWLSI